MHLELTNLGKPQATILAIKGKLFPFTSMGQNWKPINMNIFNYGIFCNYWYIILIISFLGTCFCELISTFNQIQICPINIPVIKD